jgi:hypothetical protein
MSKPNPRRAFRSETGKSTRTARTETLARRQARAVKYATPLGANHPAYIGRTADSDQER